jgi:hypothetical protein
MSAQGLEPTAPPDVDRDWPAQAADAIVDVVDKVRTQTTSKAVVAARALVFGVVIGVLGIIAFTALFIGLIRITHVGLVSVADLFGYDMPHEQAVYLSYLIVGALSLIVGGALWRLANRRAVQVGLEEEQEVAA